jgi:hypothetical protein
VGSCALSTYAVELSWLERREGIEDRRHKRLEVRHASGRHTEKKHAKGDCFQVLLELDATVHRDECVILAPHTSQKLAIGDARPAAANQRIDTVALQHCGEVYGELLVKKNAHQPAA